MGNQEPGIDFEAGQITRVRDKVNALPPAEKFKIEQTVRALFAFQGMSSVMEEAARRAKEKDGEVLDYDNPSSEITRVTQGLLTTFQQMGFELDPESLLRVLSRIFFHSQQS